MRRSLGCSVPYPIFVQLQNWLNFFIVLKLQKNTNARAAKLSASIIDACIIDAAKLLLNCLQVSSSIIDAVPLKIKQLFSNLI